MKKKWGLILTAALAIVAYSCAGAQVKKIQVVNVAAEEEALRQQAEQITAKATAVAAEMSEAATSITSSEAPLALKYTGYYVKKRDTLWSIARRKYGKGNVWKCIADFNRLKPPYTMRAKQYIKLPSDCGKSLVAKTGGIIKGLMPAATTEYTYRVLTNRSFGVGEKLVYAVKYFNVTAGYGTLEVQDISKINGREAYHIVAETRTAPFFERFYKVRDRIESYMDALGLFSHKYSKKLEEGKSRSESSINFYPERKLAVKMTKEQYIVPEYVQDVLSELYFYRTMDLNKNPEIYIDVCADDGKSYQVLVKRVGYEKISTDAGDFDCVVVKPYLKFEGIFQQKGEMTIWITNDDNKIPVLVKTDIQIGSIDAVLQKATVVRQQ